MKFRRPSSQLRYFGSIVLVAYILVSAGCGPAGLNATQASPTDQERKTSIQDMPSMTGIISGTVMVTPQTSGQNVAKPSLSCPKLDSQLNQIVQSADPINTAKQMKLKMKDDKIQVVFVLASTDTAFLKDFNVEIGSQIGNEVQAFADLKQLCDLSNREEVVTIRIPAEIFLP